MPLDPRIIAGAAPPQATPPFDPLRSMAQVYQLQGMQQQAQMGQLAMADAQRQEQERGTLARAFQGAVRTDPATGQTRIDMPAAFSAAYRTSTNPLGVLKAETEYGKSQAESRKADLEAKKADLEGKMKGLELVGNVANGVLEAIEAGADPQQAYQRGIQTVQEAGWPTQGLPPTFDRGTVVGFAAQSKQYYDALKAQHDALSRGLREQEIATQRRGQDITVRGQDLTARTQQRGQEITVRGQDIQAQTQQHTGQQRVGEREKDLRTEFNALTKDYRTVSDAYGRIQSAQETGPGDISLIFSYMKLLDPGSTVREGEFATAQNAGGVPERVIAQYNRLVSGERLAPETRKQFLDQAQGLYDQSTRDYQRTKTHYEGLAHRYGADPANVTQEFGSTATPRRQAGGGSPYGHMEPKDMTPAQREEEKRWLRQQLGK